MRRAALLVCFVLGCSKGDWKAEPPSPPRLLALTARVTLTTPTGPISVSGPLRVTDDERQLGLMFRKERLTDAEGMLFAMDDDSDHSFWMKNTFIPLDMVFIDKDGVVAGVLTDVSPLTETSRHVGKPSRYVLELDGGFCARHGVAAGTKAELHASAENRPNS